MAGAGYKLFNTGDVLTAAQVNTYLQEQVVMVFADATARTTALSGVLAEGMVSYLKDTNATEVYDGSAWVSLGSSGDITGVTAGTGISGGGTSGTVTITNDMATTITAAGDIVVGTGSGTYDNLPIGSTGQVLTADTTVSPYKVKWATAGGGTLSIAQIASGSLTTGNSFTFSSLSSYDTLVLYLVQVDVSSAATLGVRINNNSVGGNYDYNNLAIRGATFTQASSGASDDQFFLTYQENLHATTISSSMIAVFENCKASGFTRMRKLTRYTGSDSNTYQEWAEGVYKVSEAVSSLVLKLSGTNTFQNGSYTLWGG